MVVNNGLQTNLQFSPELKHTLVHMLDESEKSPATIGFSSVRILSIYFVSVKPRRLTGMCVTHCASKEPNSKASMRSESLLAQAIRC